ncbi:hypothetical protein [Pseudarthrobacter sp. NamB4]|uniref:hypothetical protein n=1 Tax=Pseudarthrobacter sp. NamB4 TaxID=2576837 RepID=UPI0026977937
MGAEPSAEVHRHAAHPENHAALPLALQAGKKDVFVRITPDSVTGCRFKVTEPLTWWTQPSGAVRTGPE